MKNGQFIVPNKIIKSALLIIIVGLFPITSKSQDILTNAEVYDFNVGDIFHTEQIMDGGGFGERIVLNIEILDKYYSDDYEILSYIREFEKSHFISDPPEWIYSYYIDTLIIGNLDSLVYDGNIDIVYSHPYLFNGRTICENEWNNEFNWGYIRWVEGCGNTGSYIENIEPTFASNLIQLVYYKKGEEEWGLPMIVSSEEIDAGTSAISIFPNPAKDYIKIIADEPEDMIIRLVTLNGKEVLNAKLNPKNGTIDISRLSPGIYILSFNLNDRVFNKRIFKR